MGEDWENTFGAREGVWLRIIPFLKEVDTNHLLSDNTESVKCPGSPNSSPGPDVAHSEPLFSPWPTSGPRASSPLD